MKKVLVTGGLGFIGSNLIKLLLKKNYYVINIDKVSYSSNKYNVKEYDNYIACDSDTKSEIVIPVFEKDKLVAVLDIDSVKENDFEHIDRINLEKICRLISK